METPVGSVSSVPRERDKKVAKKKKSIISYKPSGFPYEFCSCNELNIVMSVSYNES